MNKTKFVLIALLFAFSSFFSSLFSQSKYNDAQFATIMRSVKNGTFSELLPLTTDKMNRLLHTDQASILCIGLYLYKNGKVDEAKTMFKFGVANARHPFNTICSEKLFYISSDSEKIPLLDEKIRELKLQEKKAKKDEKDKIKEKMKELEEKKQDCLFFSLQFDKLKMSIPNLFAQRAMSAKVLITYNLVSDDDKYKLKDDFHKVMEMRALVLEKKYGEGYKVALQLIEDHPSSILISKYVFYDLLRAIFFGSKNYAENANKIKTLLQEDIKKLKLEHTALIEYLANLYLARLYEKAGSAHYKNALKYYNLAIDAAPSPYDFDDSNWFRLNFEYTHDFSSFLSHFSSTISKWDNHEWYEDIVSKTVVNLVSKKDYKTLSSFYKLVEKTKLEEQKTKIKYILARTGLIEKKKLQSTYKEIYTGKHNLFYYSLMSAYQLNLPIKDALYKKKVKRDPYPFYNGEEAMQILGSYIRYGLYSYIYIEAMRIYPEIKVEEAYSFSKELRLEGLVPDSINIVQFAMNSEKAQFSDEHLRAVYPRPYYKEVQKWAKKYDVPEYIMYALIRSESFFRQGAASHVGAQGLAQLMPFTAKEIAKSLKIKNYDVLAPDTNIHFGTYYLAQMIKRFDGKLMPSMCAYNAGPVAVGRWVKNNTIDDEDIFVESIPYDETRNYGKKLLYTACIYAYLYYNKSANQVIKEVYQDLKPLKK